MENAQRPAGRLAAIVITLLVIVVAVVVALVVTRTRPEPGPQANTPAVETALSILLSARPEGVVVRGECAEPGIEPAVVAVAESLADAGRETDSAAPVVVDYPLAGSVFPPDLVAPTFLWHDDTADAIAPIAQDMVISTDEVITWNSFPDKPEGHKTIGFLSRVSLDGKWVLSTVNEDLYVSNFVNYKFLQVFHPTRGILACYSAETGEMKGFPGADDPDYVHCNPVWAPDGSR